MKSGRLRILNDSAYPDDEVQALVRYGLQDVELKGAGLLVIVKDCRREYSGHAAWGSWIPDRARERMTRSERFLIICRIGPENVFPIYAFTRNGIRRDYESWDEALVGISAHEGMHVQHGYDGAYGERVKSGRRRVVIPSRPLPDGRAQTIQRVKIVRVRVGSERIEPKCEAFEHSLLQRYREEVKNGRLAFGLPRDP